MKNNNLFILGDSFADRCTSLINEFPMIKSWHDFLVEQGNFDNIVNIGQNGSSNWAQYKLFKETYNNESYVLMMDTAIHRFSYTDHRGPGEYQSVAQIEYHLSKNKSTLSYEQKERLKALISYFIYVQRPDYDFEMSRLMIEEIKRTVWNNDGKIVIIPVLMESTTYNHNTKNDLNRVYMKENEIFKTYKFDVNSTKLRDIRANHMINENCEILAKQITNMLKQNQNEINFNEFVEPCRDDIDKYFVKR